MRSAENFGGDGGIAGGGPMSGGGHVKLPGESKALILIWLSLMLLRLNSRVCARVVDVGAEGCIGVERTDSTSWRVAGGSAHTR